MLSCGCLYRKPKVLLIPSFFKPGDYQKIKSKELQSKLIGQKFGRLLVLSYIEKHKGRPGLLCKCDCGKEIIVVIHSLKSGDTKSCGCIQKEDLVGQVFGVLTVISIGENIGKARGWVCKCICGNTKNMRSDYLKKGIYSECVCFKEPIDLATKEVNRDYIAYYNWRSEVYAIDNYTCIVCNKVGGKIQAHHIMSYSKFAQYRTNIANGVTLCVECHREFHNIYGNRGNYGLQFIEWLEAKGTLYK